MAPHPLPLSTITCAGWLVGEERHSVGNAIIEDSGGDDDDDNEASLLLHLQNTSESSSRSRVVSVRRCVREGNAVTSAIYRWSGVIFTQSGETFNKSQSQSDLQLEDHSPSLTNMRSTHKMYSIYWNRHCPKRAIERGTQLHEINRRRCLWCDNGWMCDVVVITWQYLHITNYSIRMSICIYEPRLLVAIASERSLWWLRKD